MICVLTQYGGWFSPGAAAAGGQAGQCEQRSSSDHYREVHISSQVQKGELISKTPPPGNQSFNQRCVVNHLYINCSFGLNW